jgi:hypothetical protein
MNERIRELLLQATTLNGPFIRFKVDQGKFAELLIKECAGIAFDESAHAGRMNKPGNCLFGTNIGRRIEKHFGVEE